MFATLWWLLTLPFRLIGSLVALVGRMVGLGLGFTLMVVGVALGAGALFPIGIPVFIVGVVLTLRSLG